MRAGKNPTREQVKQLVVKYDTDGNGTLEFHEYQEMIKNWEVDLAAFKDEKMRLEAAMAAAEPKKTGGCRSRRTSKDDTSGSKPSSRHNSGDDIPRLNEAGEPKGISEAERAHIASMRGGNRRRSI